MLLVIMDETNFGLELFMPSLITELTNVATSLFGFTTIPSLDNICSSPKGTESTFAWNQR